MACLIKFTFVENFMKLSRKSSITSISSRPSRTGDRIDILTCEVDNLLHHVLLTNNSNSSGGDESVPNNEVATSVPAPHSSLPSVSSQGEAILEDQNQVKPSESVISI